MARERAPARSGAGFRRLRQGSVELVVAPELAAAARAAGLLEADGFERVFARCEQGSPERAGRAPTALLPLGPGGECVLVRRLRHGGLLGPLLRGSFWSSRRPVAELELTAALRAAGAPVPRPALAWIRHRAGPLVEAAVGTVFEEQTLDALAFLAARPGPERLQRAAAAAGRAVRRFHDAGGSHPDLQIKNLLVRETDATTACCVIDLDRARRLPALPPARRMAELMRLYRSLRKRGVLERVGPRGVAAFFAAYCDGDRELRAALRRRLPRELRKLALHAVRYREPG